MHGNISLQLARPNPSADAFRLSSIDAYGSCDLIIFEESQLKPKLNFNKKKKKN